MKYLVLGGAGFLGRSLVKCLLEKQENEVILFDRVVPDFVHDRMRVNLGAFDVQTDFKMLTQNVDVVIHCISTTSPRNFRGMYAEFDENVMPTIKLLDACVENHVQKVLYLSSGGTVYGEGSGIPAKEEDARSPINAYGIHKMCVEEVMKYYRIFCGLSCYIARIANPYGPEQNTRGVGVIAAYIRAIKNGKPLTLIGDGKTVRDYIYISDVVEALMQILQTQAEEFVFNVGTGAGNTVLDIIEMICAEMNAVPQIISKPDSGQDVVYSVLNIERLQRATGFVPQYKLKEGIRMMIQEAKIE